MIAKGLNRRQPAERFVALEIGGHTHTQIHRHTNKHTHRHTHRQADTHTYTHAEENIDQLTEVDGYAGDRREVECINRRHFVTGENGEIVRCWCGKPCHQILANAMEIKVLALEVGQVRVTKSRSCGQSGQSRPYGINT